MIRGIYTAVSGMITEEKRQEIITNNMANVSTSGFKEDKLNVKSFDEVLLQNYDNIINGKGNRTQIGGLSYGSEIDGTSTNFNQGILQNTDKKLDFAIEGNGLFKVVNENGTEYYRRSGNFSLDDNGYLIDENKNYVIGKKLDSGLDEKIKLSSDDITCDINGTIKDNGKDTFRLNTYEFNDMSKVIKNGNNLYLGTGAIENSDSKIKQGAIEGSNVNIIDAMVDMMATMRAYEANQKVISSIDETLGKTVNEVGSVR